MDEIYREVTPAFRTSTIIAQMNAIVSGAGIGVLPYFMVHADKNLVPVMAERSIERRLWLQINPESKHIALVGKP